ncbi:MAG: protein translocase subunit SecF [Candidatus Pelagibacter sp. TMED273]|nr:MAG: protein translocase subunit SecF [Candidatus Pelagibacter sp. TMED273]|tara:strand:+ start:13381 stop:14253 length:873 start_codon:yes stop_codon:yes gene_type:complete
MIRFLKDNKINFISRFRYAKYLSYSLIILGVILYFFQGPTLGIDFKGGTEVIVKLDGNLSSKQQIIAFLDEKTIKYSNIKTYGNDKIRILFENDVDQNLINNNINVVSYNKIGSTISSDLKYDAVKALLIALLLIGLYIIIRFDWYSAIGSIFALFHDILIVMTLLILFSYEFNVNIIAAFLIIIGYSLNDTIVIFDRMRENIYEYSNMELSEIINLSLNETFNRTIITSVTTLFVVSSLFIFGGGSLRGLSFALIVGVLSGTYSSIFVSTPIMMFLRDKYYVEENEREI